MPFFKKPSLEKQIRQGERECRQTQRSLERDRHQLDLEEKKLEAEIKKSARQGDKQACTILAKQLLAVRKQRTQNHAMGSRVGAVASQQRTMKANVRMGESMKNTTDIMKQMNKTMDPAKTNKTMQEFAMANEKLNMGEEVMNDVMSDLFDDTGEAEDAFVQQVLDEIGIEITDKIADAPAAHSGAVGPRPQRNNEEDLEEQLKRLRAI